MTRLLLAALLLLWPVGARATWREASSRHFVIYSEQSEADLRTTADELERFDRTLRVVLRRPDPDRSPATRLTIYVLQNQDTLQTFLGMRDVAGIYLPRYQGSIAFTHRGAGWSAQDDQLNPRIVLFHEYTHHFLYNNFALGAPLWFSEGYPEFWSTTRINPNGTVDVGLPDGHRAGELNYLDPVPVPRLINLRYPVTDGAVVAATYARGWVLSHYLTFEPSRRGQLDTYLRALNEGRTPEEAAAAFGDLRQLDRELQRYMVGNHFNYVTMPADQVRPAGTIQIRTVGPGEAAIMAVKMRSKRGVTERQALSLAPDGRRAAAPYPNDPAVQVVLAEVEYDAHNYAEAEAAADRAIAADPRNVDALLFKARAIAGRLTAPAGTTPAGAAPAPASPDRAAGWHEVQRLIAAANAIDHEDPEPLYAFYESFAAAGLPPTRNAVEGLLDAQALAPEDRDLRIQAGRMLLLNRDARHARAMLAPITGDAHAGDLGPRIAAILATLDDTNTAAAVAQLDAALRQREGARRSR